MCKVVVRVFYDETKNNILIMSVLLSPHESV